MTTSAVNSAFPDTFATKAEAPSQISDLSPALVSLSEFHCIDISGEDAIVFLQGQFTNHIPDLATGECHLTGYCNPKGRALAVLWLLRKQNGCCLLVPQDLAEGLVKRLQIYKMRAKVEIGVASQHAVFGLINAEDSTGSKVDGAQLWRVDEFRRFLSIPADNVDTFLDVCALPLVESGYWRLSQILAGEPMVYASTQEDLIPQHMNLDLVDGVSFTKGCYPGQEIVARLRYLGKLKQRMITGICQGNKPLLPGTPVFIEEKENKAGIVVDSINVGSFNYLSINVPASHIEAGDIHVNTPDGAVLERLEMPYTITLEKESS